MKKRRPRKKPNTSVTAAAFRLAFWDIDQHERELRKLDRVQEDLGIALMKLAAKVRSQDKQQLHLHTAMADLLKRIVKLERN